MGNLESTETTYEGASPSPDDTNEFGEVRGTCRQRVAGISWIGGVVRDNIEGPFAVDRQGSE